MIDQYRVSQKNESFVHAGWSTGTHIEDGYGVVEGSLSRETDLAEVRIHLSLTFTKSDPFPFLSLGLYGRLNQQKKIPATISHMMDQVKKIIESIAAKILQCVIEEFSHRIQNCIVAR